MGGFGNSYVLETGIYTAVSTITCIRRGQDGVEWGHGRRLPVSHRRAYRRTQERRCAGEAQTTNPRHSPTRTITPLSSRGTGSREKQAAILGACIALPCIDNPQITANAYPPLPMARRPMYGALRVKLDLWGTFLRFVYPEKPSVPLNTSWYWQVEYYEICLTRPTIRNL